MPHLQRQRQAAHFASRPEASRVTPVRTLRALVKYLDSIPGDRIADLEIPNGIPLVYRLGTGMRPVAPGGRYLDQLPTG